MTKRVHILSAVNAANVSKDGSVYTIRDVCGATDGIVMNGRMYPGDQLAAGIASLEGKPAPAGHPKNASGQHISALNGEALASAWIGSYARNARHTAGRTLVDVVVNEAQAKAHPVGAKLIERLDAAIAGTNAEPIHVSTGLMLDEVQANGESKGKRYQTIATNLRYDHLAILMNESGAGTPDEGVGMFLNSEGESEEIETVEVNAEPEDKRFIGLTGWIRKLLGNSGELSFEQIASGIQSILPKDAWPREVFPRYVVWADYSSDKLYKQDYAISSDGSVSFTSDPIEVIREVEYKPVINTKDDPVKEKILAALNAAGIHTAGLDDPQLLSAYNSLVTAPVAEKLNAANSKIAGIEANAAAAADVEVSALAADLAVNSSLTIDDLKKLGLARLKEIKANAKGAAPVVVAAVAANAADEFDGYDINAL